MLLSQSDFIHFVKILNNYKSKRGQNAKVKHIGFA